VVSGINNGPNLGENEFYSGTVAGAAEGAKHGIPSIAVSVTERENLDFAPAASFTAQLARQVGEKGLPPGVALNVNVPHPRYQGVEVTRQCRKISRNVMVEGRDPRGRPYYWMDEQIPLDNAEPGSDYAAVALRQHRRRSHRQAANLDGCSSGEPAIVRSALTTRLEQSKTGRSTTGGFPGGSVPGTN
jgi:5'/3'-nucleotidase SurE